MDEKKILEIQIEILYKIFDMWHNNTDNQHYEDFNAAANKFKEELYDLYFELRNMLTNLD